MCNIATDNSNSYTGKIDIFNILFDKVTYLRDECIDFIKTHNKDKNISIEATEEIFHYFKKYKPEDFDEFI
jgi:hypothetical protein